jgi:hypothetical protein
VVEDSLSSQHIRFLKKKEEGYEQLGIVDARLFSRFYVQ